MACGGLVVEGYGYIGGFFGFPSSERFQSRPEFVGVVAVVPVVFQVFPPELGFVVLDEPVDILVLFG